MNIGDGLITWGYIRWHEHTRELYIIHVLKVSLFCGGHT